MKVVGLVSGGKDSCYALMQAVKYGHQVIALANLQPVQDEMDSWMYQSVGHEAIEAYARAFGVPLFRARIDGIAEQQTLHYAPRSAEDEVESLYYLLAEIKRRMPEVEAVSSGAILSDYQRNRVESVCSRLGLVSLAYLWRRDQQELLGEMIDSGVSAVLIKVAALGLTHKHLGKSLAELQPMLQQLALKYGINPCGEGGEYESFTLDCPLFLERIVIDETEVVEHSRDACYLRIKRFHMECKGSKGTEPPPSITYLPPRAKTSALPSARPEVTPPPLVSHLHFASTPSTLQNVSLSEQVSDIITQLKGRLAASSLRLDDVRFAWVYVRDMQQFPALNAEYAKHFPSQPPCRATVQLPWTGPGDVKLEFIIDRPASRSVLHVQSISLWAAACIGPYAQAVADDEIVTLSGQIGLHAPTMQLVSAEPEAQCECALRNLAAVLSVVGSQPAFALAAVCFVTSDAHVARVRPLVSAWLSSRADVTYLVVPALPKGALVELQLTAAKSPPSHSSEERVLAEKAPLRTAFARSGNCQLVRLTLPSLTSDTPPVECANFATYRRTKSDAVLYARVWHTTNHSPSSEWCTRFREALGSEAPLSLVEASTVLDSSGIVVNATVEIAMRGTAAD